MRNFAPAGEYSTIDSAILVGGALFAGNYFGGAVKTAAEELFNIPNWGVTVESSTGWGIYMVSSNGGAMSQPNSMYSEYVILAALAKRQENTAVTTKVHDWWTRYIGDNGPSTTNTPVENPYNGHNTLSYCTGGTHCWMPSFLIQFPWYMIKEQQTNPYYVETFQSWLMG